MGDGDLERVRFHKAAAARMTGMPGMAGADARMQAPNPWTREAPPTPLEQPLQFLGASGEFPDGQVDAGSLPELAALRDSDMAQRYALDGEGSADSKLDTAAEGIALAGVGLAERFRELSAGTYAELDALQAGAMSTSGPSQKDMEAYQGSLSELEMVKSRQDELREDKRIINDAQTAVAVEKAETNAAGMAAIENQNKIAVAEEEEFNRAASEEATQSIDEVKATAAEMKAMKIDPKRAFSHMSNGEKVFWRIAMVLEGALAGFQGKQGQLADHVTSIIDRDIAMQQKEFGQKRALLGAQQSVHGLVMDKLQDASARRSMTRSLQTRAAQDMLHSQMAKLDGPAAQAAGDALNAQLDADALQDERKALEQETAARLKNLRMKKADPRLAFDILKEKTDMNKQFADLALKDDEASAKRRKELGTETPGNKLLRQNTEKYGKMTAAEMNMLGIVQKLRKMMEDPDAPGLFTRLATGGTTNWMVSKENTKKYRAILNLQNIMLAKRSGAAVSRPEYERFIKEFGDATVGSDEQAAVLQNYENQLITAIQQKGATYGGVGTVGAFEANLEGLRGDNPDGEKAKPTPMAR